MDIDPLIRTDGNGVITMITLGLSDDRSGPRANENCTNTKQKMIEVSLKKNYFYPYKAIRS